MSLLRSQSEHARTLIRPYTTIIIFRGLMSAHNENHKTQYTVNGISHGKLWFALTDMRYANGWFFFVLKYKKNNKTNLEKRSNLFIQIVLLYHCNLCTFIYWTTLLFIGIPSLNCFRITPLNINVSETLFQLNQSCSLDDSWYGVARITHYTVF